jgi:hypothetical protein
MGSIGNAISSLFSLHGSYRFTTLIYTFDIPASDVEMASREHTDGSLTVKGSINVIKKKSTSKLKEDILRRKFTA